MNKSFFIVAVFVLVFLVACSDTMVFDRSHRICGDGWHKDSIVAFDFNIYDTLALHNINITLRNNVAYPYCNLFLFVRTFSPYGDSVCDTLEYMLTDSYGKWLGSGFSKIIDNNLEYKRMVQFPKIGRYRMEIKQGMRAYLLPEILNVGVKIEKD